MKIEATIYDLCQANDTMCVDCVLYPICETCDTAPWDIEVSIEVNDDE